MGWVKSFVTLAVMESLKPGAQPTEEKGRDRIGREGDCAMYVNKHNNTQLTEASGRTRL
jgi:hypothetical protein